MLTVLPSVNIAMRVVPPVRAKMPHRRNRCFMRVVRVLEEILGIRKHMGLTSSANDQTGSANEECRR
jgi:hypothetical protein